MFTDTSCGFAKEFLLGWNLLEKQKHVTERTYKELCVANTKREKGGGELEASQSKHMRSSQKHVEVWGECRGMTC